MQKAELCTLRRCVLHWRVGAQSLSTQGSDCPADDSWALSFRPGGTRASTPPAVQGDFLALPVGRLAAPAFETPGMKLPPSHAGPC